MLKNFALATGIALVALSAAAPAALADHKGDGKKSEKKWKDGKYWIGGPVYIGPNNIGYGYKGAYAAYTPHTSYDYEDDDTCVVKKVKVWDKYEGDWDWKKKVVCY